MSNEQGNDTAQAFQVGDTVWTRLPGEQEISEGVVMELANDQGGKRAYVCGPIGYEHDSIGFAMWVGFELLAHAPDAPAASEPAAPAPAAMVDAWTARGLERQHAAPAAAAADGSTVAADAADAADEAEDERASWGPDDDEQQEDATL